MPSELLINAINSTLNSGTCDQKVLAVSALAQLPDCVDLLEQCLVDKDADIVISACHAIGQQRNVDQGLLIQIALDHPDSDVRLASLEVLNVHGQGRQYTEALLTLLTDEHEQWLDEWDNSIDIQLQACKNLLKQAQILNQSEVQQLIDRYRQDPEPELAQTLCYLIAKVKPEWLNQQITQADIATQRQIVKALTDKPCLYRATKSADNIVKRIAVQRLAGLDAREYLQDFLLWLDDTDFDIFHCSAVKLAEWQYPVSHHYIQPVISAGRHKLDCALPLLAEQAFLQLNQMWQNRQLPIHNLAVFLRLALTYKSDTDKLISDYCQQFFRLSTGVQIESLQILTGSKTLLFPVAFLRQCLESEVPDNGVRRLLISYLTNIKSEPHNDYLKSLYFPDDGKIITQPPVQHNADSKNTATSERTLPGTEDEIAPPEQTSTLSVLLNQSESRQPEVSYSNPLPQELEHFEPLLQHQQARYSAGKRNRAARIESLPSQALARELCANKQWIEKAVNTDPDIWLLKACIQFDISYAGVRSAELDNWLFNSDSDVQKQLLVLDWLGKDLPETVINQALQAANPALTVKAITLCKDKARLQSQLYHPFIDVKKQAFKQLLLLADNQPEQMHILLAKALNSDELVDLISVQQLEANEELLAEQILAGSLTALAASVRYMAHEKGK